MLSKKSFDTISFTLANMRFEKWCIELKSDLDYAITEALNKDGRLCKKTKEKILNTFLEQMVIQAKRKAVR